MKNIYFLFAIVVFLFSCEKKNSYECTTVDGAANGNAPVTLKMTEKQMKRYEKNNTIEIDGSNQIFSNGEKYTTCVLKD